MFICVNLWSNELSLIMKLKNIMLTYRNMQIRHFTDAGATVRGVHVYVSIEGSTCLHIYVSEKGLKFTDNTTSKINPDEVLIKIQIGNFIGVTHKTDKIIRAEPHLISFVVIKKSATSSVSILVTSSISILVTSSVSILVTTSSVSILVTSSVSILVTSSVSIFY
ncbi:hypothetical protein Avbf_17762 [Armadillidium vulgare]|nr:hypothetical protein Avbf_17762 [Armadillidium vulgare]